MCENGPRSISWSIRSRVSSVKIVEEVDIKISVWPEVDWSGGTMVHEDGGSVSTESGVSTKAVSKRVCLHSMAHATMEGPT